MNSIPVIRGRLAGFLEDFAKSPAGRRTTDERARPEAKAANSDGSTDRDSAQSVAAARGEVLTQTSQQVASPAPTAPLRGHLIDRLV